MVLPLPRLQAGLQGRIKAPGQRFRLRFRQFFLAGAVKKRIHGLFHVECHRHRRVQPDYPVTDGGVKYHHPQASRYHPQPVTLTRSRAVSLFLLCTHKFP
ncbi:Uncharacterised protein [Salmonella enterica subsp. enterica serovar Bovismorbificans]|nr:Uncharacterised protein [Salmonella enterica subsp. enterica serovar Bovismorbificans]CPR78755.1 Uncharacterised protein [Salmonella enterica subsp. enterica serovar Bovismorbificans]